MNGCEYCHGTGRRIICKSIRGRTLTAPCEVCTALLDKARRAFERMLRRKQTEINRQSIGNQSEPK